MPKVTKRANSSSTVSSAASMPASSSTSSASRKHVRSSDVGTADLPMDVNGTNTEVDTPTRPSKKAKTKGLPIHQKAQGFKAGFADDASDDDILKRQMRAWTSKHYEHFTMPPVIDASDLVVVKYTFHCKPYALSFLLHWDWTRSFLSGHWTWSSGLSTPTEHAVLWEYCFMFFCGMVAYAFPCRCPNITVTRARHDDSTSNLGRHINMCKAVPAAQAAGQLTMPMFAAGSMYSEARLRFLIVKWCACNSQPMLIVKDKAYIEQLKMFNQGVTIPSNTTVSRDIK
ncbi:hypothetical protein BT96DRAFT_1002287 [Gymnopus androsaceus JB14]|uniref:Uncharacterized protein n=1 Tax=Gymnopus androsaceus JB14 TaxID=1447944 RepID=A0A6A4GYM8_9AGAR|nr:hypothetical protein BT96DRAFT_1002287 [Gymnopus androsaceus JB14]